MFMKTRQYGNNLAALVSAHIDDFVNKKKEKKKTKLIWKNKTGDPKEQKMFPLLKLTTTTFTIQHLERERENESLCKMVYNFIDFLFNFCFLFSSYYRHIIIITVIWTQILVTNGK